MRSLAPVIVLLFVAGCLQPSQGPPTRSVHGLPPTDQTATSDRMPGLRMDGEAVEDAPAVTVDVVVHNAGPHTYRYATGCRASPWSERLSDASGTDVKIRRPPYELGCPDYIADDFTPGKNQSFHVQWNGTTWDASGRDAAGGETGTYLPAPKGEYAWTITYTAYAPGSQDQETRSLPLRFRVEVR